MLRALSVGAGGPAYLPKAASIYYSGLLMKNPLLSMGNGKAFSLISRPPYGGNPCDRFDMATIDPLSFVERRIVCLSVSVGSYQT